MNIYFHKTFKKLYKKQPQKIQKKFSEQISLFVNDPFDPILNNHSLSGKIKGFRSINITGNVRAWYKVEKKGVVFVKIGSHGQLY